MVRGVCGEGNTAGQQIYQGIESSQRGQKGDSQIDEGRQPGKEYGSALNLVTAAALCIADQDKGGIGDGNLGGVAKRWR